MEVTYEKGEGALSGNDALTTPLDVAKIDGTEAVQEIGLDDGPDGSTVDKVLEVISSGGFSLLRKRQDTR